MNSHASYSFEKTYILKAHSPIIHFQHDQAGATLRATEVKPKLDHFLKQKIANKDIYKKCLIGDSEALNYKLHFEALNNNAGKDTPKIYYGNMNVPEHKRIKCILRDCRMTVICLSKELMDEIDKYIGEFFIVHNFGRMQNKGFGSFTVRNTQYTKTEIGNFLSEHAGARRFFYISGYSDNDTTKMFDDIAKIYGIMKSGFNWGGSYHRSYLFEYFIDKKTGNEKAYMKKEKISPAIVHPKNKKRAFPEQNYSEYKYTRALLGIGDHISYIAGFGKEKNEKGMYPTTGREQINISNSEFERLASPIFFKIIGDVIYMVPKRVNEKILGKTFYFKNTETNMSISIDVPDAFDIDDFMKYFADRYNKDSKQKNEKGFTVGYSIGKDIKYEETKKGDVI